MKKKKVASIHFDDTAILAAIPLPPSLIDHPLSLSFFFKKPLGDVRSQICYITQSDRMYVPNKSAKPSVKSR